MNLKDKNFFWRLKESHLHLEDKNNSEAVKYPIFKTKSEEKAYYKKFPTIYHLRHHVMTQEVDDIRLVYLAMHHILKYRGHFIQEGIPMTVSNIDIKANIENLFKALNVKIKMKKNYKQVEPINYHHKSSQSTRKARGKMV